MALPISQRQMELVRAFRAFEQAHGRTPSVRELANQLDRAASTVHQMLRALEKKGYLVNGGDAHGWRLHEARIAADADHAAPSGVGGAFSENEGPMAAMRRVPIRGRIAAGAPIEAIDDPREHVLMPRDGVPDDAYALRVVGNSMIDDHILDGDLVVIRPQPRVENGQIAVALLDDGTATLKRVYVEPDAAGGTTRVRLQPANDALDPIYVESVKIQGRAIGVMRNLP